MSEIASPDSLPENTPNFLDFFTHQLIPSGPQCCTDIAELEKYITQTIKYLSELFGTGLITIYLYDKDNNQFTPFGFLQKDDPLQPYTLSDSLPGYILKMGDTVQYADIRTAPYAYQVDEAIQSGIYIPIYCFSEQLGVLAVESLQQNVVSDNDIALLEIIARQIGMVVGTIIFARKSRDNSNKIQLIHDIVSKILSLQNESEISQSSADLLAQYLPCDLVGIMLVDETMSYLVVTGLAGNHAHLSLPGFQIPVNVGLTGKAYQLRVSGLYDDVDITQEYYSYPGWRAGSELCVPIIDESHVLGVINVESERKNAYSIDDLALLESIAGIICSVLVNLRRYREVKQRIEAQALAENRLVRSARLAAVGEMAAGVAHELNNPLTTVIGFLELVLDEMPEEISFRPDVELALKEAQRAREVVRRLLDFSRQSGNIFIRADINELITDTVPLIKHQYDTGGIILNLELAGGLPYLNINPSQIQQVLINLLHNAAQALPNGGDVRIRTGVQVKNGRMGVLIQVCDNGEGIPSEIYDRIFEPFFTTRPVGKGTGLGLSVSYGIVTNHGGHIEVESKLNEGSCFTIWLPMEAAKE